MNTPITLNIVRLPSGHFRAVAGTVEAESYFATEAAKFAAAKFFGVAPDEIETEAVSAVINVRVRPKAISP